MPTFKADGEIDVATAPDLDTRLRQEIDGTRGNLLIDCTDLTFLDSTGIRVLVGIARSLEEQDRALVMVNVPAACRRSIEVCGVAELLGLTITGARD